MAGLANNKSTLRQCRKCGKKVPLAGFYKKAERSDSWCKSCRLLDRRQKYKKKSSEGIKVKPVGYPNVEILGEELALIAAAILGLSE